ncbi:hypothetical protein F2Q69_00012125 [Brassica cretica]|uniref:NAD-dependent epimerase/dehydratase domain-containing protein n=1 Tax=Brassica cretica TaxID=69181 RepID=A0A8S9R1I6_BRACR|nr:hypothetical protein F2Q69_00012125 [Brassica cretica]
MATNGTTTKPPLMPSPLRNSKFLQSNMWILVTGGADFIGSKDNLKKWIGHPRFELIRHEMATNVTTTKPPLMPSPLRNSKFLQSNMRIFVTGGADFIEMATNVTTTKPPLMPSPLRNSKFLQSNMRIFVTGGADFIGSHLVDRLMQNEKNEVIDCR